MSSGDLALLKARLRAQLPADASGRHHLQRAGQRGNGSRSRLTLSRRPGHRAHGRQPPAPQRLTDLRSRQALRSSALRATAAPAASALRR